MYTLEKISGKEREK